MNGFVIFGYYGRGNLGDETNLRELVAFIRQNNPDAEITVISASPEQTANELRVFAVHKYHLVDLYYAIHTAEMLIGGGGSLFQDRTSLRSLIYYSIIVLLAKINKVRIFMYGQGIGPLRSWFGRLLAGKVLSMAELITVRDRLSIISLAELNVRRPEIFITAEPLLLLPPLPAHLIQSYWTNFPSERRLKLGLIIQENGFLKKKFWHQLINCLSWDQNIELYLIPIDKKDQAFIKEMAINFDISILPTWNGWEELQKALGGLDLVASSRLHGLVAAVIQGVPCFGLVLDPKIEGFCLQLEVPFLRLTTKMEWLNLGNRLLSFLYKPLPERRPWESKLAFWKARAKENQLLLKKYLTS